MRCIVVTGAGRAFCAGGDVKDFVDNLERIGVHVKELTTYLHGTVSRFCRSDKPVIMAINGVAAGGGLSFALSGDLVVAAESARFTMAYSKIAATPDGSSSYFLPRLVGMRRAMELYFTNRVLSAREALEWGLVTRVVPDAELSVARVDLGCWTGDVTAQEILRLLGSANGTVDSSYLYGTAFLYGTAQPATPGTGDIDAPDNTVLAQR